MSLRDPSQGFEKGRWDLQRLYVNNVCGKKRKEIAVAIILMRKSIQCQTYTLSHPQTTH